MKRKLQTLVLLACLGVIYAQDNNCPSGDYTFYNDQTSTCYVLKGAGQSGGAEWDTAQRDCGYTGGKLAAITTQEESDYVSAQLGTFFHDKSNPTDGSSPQYYDGAWIGLKEDEGTYRWRWPQYDVTMQQQGCFSNSNTNQGFDVTNEVPGGYNSMTPDNCINYCATLRVTNDQLQYAAVTGRGFCMCTPLFIWGPPIGAYCTLTCPGNDQLLCGGNFTSYVYFLPGTPALWRGDQPNYYNNGYQTCGALLESFNSWKLGDENCYSDNHAMCFIDDPSCSSTSGGYRLRINDVCVYISYATMSWFEARVECDDLGGGVLAGFPDVAFHQQVIDELQRHSIVNHIWVNAVASEWRWDNGDKFFFTNWENRQPDSRTENCGRINANIRLDLSSNYLFWSDADCNNRLPFLCEIELGTTTTTTTTEPTTTSAPTTTSEPTTTASSGGGGGGNSGGGGSGTTGSGMTSASPLGPTTTSSGTSSAGPILTTTPTDTPTTAADSPETTTSATTTTDSTSGSGRSTTSGSGGSGGSGSDTTTTGGDNGGSDPDSGASGTPDAGASTGDSSSGMGTFEIVLIVIICILVLLVIIAVVLFMRYKKKNQEAGRVNPGKSYDARCDASNASAEEIYIPPSETGSQSGLMADPSIFKPSAYGNPNYGNNPYYSSPRYGGKPQRISLE